MKTTLPKELTTQQEVEKFIALLWANDEFYHLDDPAEDIVNVKTGEPLFTDEEATQLNALIKQAFDICEVWELPIVGTILDEMTDQEEKIFNNLHKDHPDNHEHRNFFFDDEQQ